MQVVLGIENGDLRLALQLYLDEEPGLFIVGAATEAASLRALLHTASPDLLILGWDLPGYPTVSLLAEVRRLEEPPQVIVLGSDEGARQTALAAGADAYVLIGDLPVDLTSNVRQARMRHRNPGGTAPVPASNSPPKRAQEQ
jgi:DNA-binding NarL/FixJ family response regulator